MGSERVVALVGLGLLCLLPAGCTWLTPPPGPVSLPQVEVPPVVRVSATPAYRLTVEPAFADIPSRLVVLYARIETLGDERLHFNPSNVQLELPNGTTARVFDRARAAAVIERTNLAVWSTDYTRDRRQRYPLGGLRTETKRRLKTEMLGGLLNEADVTRYRPLAGYLVVDTQVPLSSLDGTTMAVVANRVGDAAPVRETYQFAASRTGQVAR